MNLKKFENFVNESTEITEFKEDGERVSAYSQIRTDYKIEDLAKKLEHYQNWKEWFDNDAESAIRYILNLVKDEFGIIIIGFNFVERHDNIQLLLGQFKDLNGNYVNKRSQLEEIASFLFKRNDQIASEINLEKVRAGMDRSNSGITLRLEI